MWKWHTQWYFPMRTVPDLFSPLQEMRRRLFLYNQKCKSKQWSGTQLADADSDGFCSTQAGLPEANTSTQAVGSLHDRLTVIVTTSPIPDHPSTAMIEHTVKSFGSVPGLLSCRIIICCDGTRQGVTSDCLKVMPFLWLNLSGSPRCSLERPFFTQVTLGCVFPVLA